MFGISAKICPKQTADGYWNYVLNFELNNLTGAAANVQILPIAEGTFSSIMPNPVPTGWNSMTAIFTDNAISDAGKEICFRVLITNPDNGSKCYADNFRFGGYRVFGGDRFLFEENFGTANADYAAD